MLIELLRDLTGRLDEDLPPYVVRSMSVDVEAFQSTLRASGDVFIDRTLNQYPSLSALEKTAAFAIRSSSRKASLVGAASGIAGFFGVPPEAAARLVQSVRLAQRLAIIYGHDPRTDRGAMHVRRALAAGWEVELPGQTKVDMRISDLRNVVRLQLPAPQHGGDWLARALLNQATKTVGARLGRFIPGLGAGLGAYQAHRTAQKMGKRMHKTYVRSYQHPKPTGIEDAIEV